MRRSLVALLLVALALPTPSAALVPPADDAGSGEDAPGVRREEFRVEPYLVYHGNLSPPSDSDYYAFVVDVDSPFRLSASNRLLCVYLRDSEGDSVDARCSLTATPVGALVEAELAPGTYYLLFHSLDVRGPYRFRFTLDGSDPNVDSPGARPAPPPTDPCPPHPAGEETQTSGAGDPRMPSLTWMATKTGSRAVVVWEGVRGLSELVYTVNGGVVQISRVVSATATHVHVVDGLPVGGVLCFKAREVEGVGPLAVSGWHALRLRNAMNAYDEADGSYSLNLLVVLNEAPWARADVERALDAFATRLWDATDGHVRAGRILLLVDDYERHNSGLWCWIARLSAPGCSFAADVVFVHEVPPYAAGMANVDGIQSATAAIWMNNVFEATPVLEASPEAEVAPVLLHELGHYAFGMADLYASLVDVGGCLDEANDLSVMTSRRAYTEFDSAATPCPNAAEIDGYVPSWTLLRERFPRVPERIGAPDPGPLGEGGAYSRSTFVVAP